MQWNHILGATYKIEYDSARTTSFSPAVSLSLVHVKASSSSLTIIIIETLEIQIYARNKFPLFQDVIE